MAIDMVRRQSRRKQKSRTSICDLPQHIISDILSRLAVMTAVQSMCLCKTLLSSVTEDPLFAATQISRCSKTLSLLYPPAFDLATGGFMYLIDEHISGAGRLSTKKSLVAKLSFENLPPAYVQVLGSCNGLILCLLGEYSSDIDLYLYNPLKGSEWVELPTPSIESPQFESKADYGFGFCPESNLYKIIRVVSFKSSAARCEVHSLGSHEWRCLGDAPFKGEDSLSGKKRPLHWTTLNGALHMLTNIGQKLFICCFKIREEELTLLVPLPFHNFAGYEISLGVLFDCLVVFCASHDSSRIDIWVMNEYGVKESWEKRWVIGSNVLKGLEAIWLKPIKFRDDGLLLMSYKDFAGFAMVSYDTQSSKIRKHRLQDEGIEDCDRIDHVPSLLSPEDVVMGAY